MIELTMVECRKCKLTYMTKADTHVSECPECKTRNSLIVLKDDYKHREEVEDFINKVINKMKVKCSNCNDQLQIFKLDDKECTFKCDNCDFTIGITFKEQEGTLC